MALSKVGILVVRGTRGIAQKIAADQKITTQAVQQWIARNHENLTRVSVLEIIKRESGVNEDVLLEPSCKETTNVIQENT